MLRCASAWVAALAYCCCCCCCWAWVSISAFPFRLPFRGATKAPNQRFVFVRPVVWPLACSSSSSDQSNDRSSNATATALSSASSSSSSSFSMEQDWALIDAVPQFTIHADGSDRPLTFWNQLWTQLSASVPELSRRSPGELRARYEELHRNNNNTKTTHRRSGPQPPVLDQWSVSSDGTKVWGSPVDTRSSTICVAVASRGWLASDPWTSAAWDGAADAGGGYVVAPGGAVYELGEPAPEAVRPTTGALFPKELFSEMSGLAATLVVVAGLSAAIGFAAGSSFPTAPTTPTTTAVTKYVPGSIGERRVLQERRIAGTELRLVRQEESVVRLRSKIDADRALLERDQRGLEKLRALEASRGGGVFVIDPGVGSTRSVPAAPGDPTLAEQRASQERRVAGTELRLVRETERVATTESKMRVARAVLRRDQIGLDELKKVEASEGGDAVVAGQLL